MAYVGTSRAFTVHWSDLAKCLPIENDAVSTKRRRELFETFDPQGAGILYQVRVVKAFFRMLPQPRGSLDMRLVVQQAWSVTRDIVTPITPIGTDRMDRNQFRVLCIYLWYFYKLWDVFVQVSGLGAENRKVTQKQFEEMLPWIRDWGIQDAAMWVTSPDAWFEAIDRKGQGWVIFEDLAEFILKCAVPQLCVAGEEECRAEAIRLLLKTHPHMMEKAIPKQDRNWGGAAPPVPPPGQKRPPMRMDLDVMEQGGISSRNRRYTTQYASDYLSPQYLPLQVAPASYPTARSRVYPARPPSDFSTGMGLIRSSSMPDATMRTQGMDKQALRMKLENQLDMYSTGQMRKLLKVAGGMVLGPGMQ